MWAREKKSGKTCKSRKEGQRWIDGYEAVAARAQALSATRQVYPAAREADFMPMLVREAELEYAANYVIRCCHNRALPEGKKLWEKMQEGPVLGWITFLLPAGQGVLRGKSSRRSKLRGSG